MNLSEDNKISIIIVDDHPVVAQGLIYLLEKVTYLKIMGAFTNGKEALAFLKNHFIDVILLDISLPDINGIELCRDIKDIYPKTCILAISNHNERSIITNMLQNGASGYLLKNASLEELTKAITEGIGGKLTLSPDVASILAQPQKSATKFPRLTRREKEILKLVAEGRTTQNIAEKLFISPLTVETHRRNLMHKFEVKNTAALIKAAVEQKLI